MPFDKLLCLRATDGFRLGQKVRFSADQHARDEGLIAELTELATQGTSVRKDCFLLEFVGVGMRLCVPLHNCRQQVSGRVHEYQLVQTLPSCPA